MFVALVILGVSFLGCAAALTEVYLTLIIVSNLDAGNKRQPILQKSVCQLGRTTKVYSLKMVAKSIAKYRMEMNAIFILLKACMTLPLVLNVVLDVQLSVISIAKQKPVVVAVFANNWLLN